jgi:putative membrane protein
MKKNTWNILLIGILFISFSCGNKKDDSKDVAENQNEEKFDDTNLEKDTEFAVNAADGGLYEVQLGQLAVANASSEQVKKFGQSMIDDHGKANEELKTTAQQKNISIPSALSEKKQKKYDDLAQKKGADFDKDYIDMMVSDHKDDIDAFEKEAKDGKDPDLKAWASNKLPTLRHHLEMAKEAQDALKNEKH